MVLVDSEKVVMLMDMWSRFLIALGNGGRRVGSWLGFL